MKKPLDKNRILHQWNKLRGVPIELDLAEYKRTVAKINQQDLQKASDKELEQASSRLREQARRGTSLDDLLVEAFSLVREAAARTIGLRPFDVQLIAGIAMQQGKLVEMNTGEGKTLAAVFPAFLNALAGAGVHIHTFNDYLARRDAEWMGPIYTFLGLSVGCVQEGMSPGERRQAYASDLTYTTAKEAGFDYLRDHLCYRKEDWVHRPFAYAIVDEADSILIDEARIPLVIAGVADDDDADPSRFAQIVKGLVEGLDFDTDEGKRNVYLTDSGLERIEKTLECGDLHAPQNLNLLTKLHQALHTEFLLHRDIDYIVRNGKIEIVDEFTGRVVEDRHWPDGLQAAVEAKESLRRGSAGSILGSITLQHYLRLYPKICGMTATARPAADELYEFYKLKVVVIPPHRPSVRIDHPDVVFTHKAAKNEALIQEIQHRHDTGRPILVGTASIEESEELASGLEKAGIACQVLNAKNDEKEAKIIAQAGAPGAVTISTNMAGRGTDIKLGGDSEQERDQVVNLGGLYVIGTNRFESLRVDHQLRGRAGRQGDPGASRFFISLEDNLIERFGFKNLLPKSIRSLRQLAPIENPLVHQEIARGQRILEGQNLEIRKTLWKYSSLVEKQRATIQQRRRQVLLETSSPGVAAEETPDRYEKLEILLGKDSLRNIERQITVYQIDRCWAEHLAMIADVRESIHLMGVGGKHPIDEFHKIVNDAFYQLEGKIRGEILDTFQSLPISKGGIDLERQGIKGPSSTWTYLINDNPFEEMLKGGNIGFSAAAAAAYGPLFIVLKLFQRYYRRK